MEEKIVSKEFKMNGGKEEKTQKLSYEELNTACAELSQQLQNQNEYIKKLYKGYQEVTAALQAKRLDYLFRVVEYNNDTYHFDNDFVMACIREIQEALTVTAEEDKEVN